MLLTTSPHRRAIRFRRSNFAAQKIPARPPPQRDEEKIHAAVVQHLEMRGVPGLVWFHVGNEGALGLREKGRSQVWHH
jgi:hypothetical protein